MGKANLFYDSTSKIKAMADVRPIAIDDADSIIRSFHLNLNTKNPGKAVQNGEGVVNGDAVQNGKAVVNGNGVAVVNGNGA